MLRGLGWAVMKFYGVCYSWEGGNWKCWKMGGTYVWLIGGGGGGFTAHEFGRVFF